MISICPELSDNMYTYQPTQSLHTYVMWLCWLVLLPLYVEALAAKRRRHRIVIRQRQSDIKSGSSQRSRCNCWIWSVALEFVGTQYSEDDAVLRQEKRQSVMRIEDRRTVPIEKNVCIISEVLWVIKKM